MSKRIEILDDVGAVIKTIIADEVFAEAQYPGKWRLDAFVRTPKGLGSIISSAALSERFTDDEWIELDISSQHDRVAAPAAQRQQASIRRAKDALFLRDRVDLSAAETGTRVQAMCQVLQDKGIIVDAAARAAEILDVSTVTQEELP